MKMLQWELLYAALGMGSTCGTTVLGAAMVFFKGEMSRTVQRRPGPGGRRIFDAAEMRKNGPEGRLWPAFCP